MPIGWYPQNPELAQQTQTDAGGTTVNTEFPVRYSLPTPAALSANGCVAATLLTVGAQAGLTAGITQPDVPRNVSIVGGDTDQTGVVTVHGTNMNGDVITEALTTNGTTKVVGAKAFASVTSYDLPAYTTDGAETISIGFDNKLGLPHKLSRNTVQMAFLNKALEGTAPTVAVSATALESNTCKLNSALAGTQVDIYYQYP